MFNFDEEQTSTMTHLMQSLREHHPIERVAIRVIEALHSFYTPQDLDRSVYHTFAEPLVAFMAIQCLTEEGSPRPLSDIPSLCSRAQFSMRLRGYHYLWRTALDAKIIKPKDLPVDLTGDGFDTDKIYCPSSRASTKHDKTCIITPKSHLIALQCFSDVDSSSSNHSLVHINSLESSISMPLTISIERILIRDISFQIPRFQRILLIYYTMYFLTLAHYLYSMSLLCQ